MTERMLNKYQVQEQVGLHFNTITKKSILGEFPKSRASVTVSDKSSIGLGRNPRKTRS